MYLNKLGFDFPIPYAGKIAETKNSILLVSLFWCLCCVNKNRVIQNACHLSEAMNTLYSIVLFIHIRVCIA